MATSGSARLVHPTTGQPLGGGPVGRPRASLAEGRYGPYDAADPASQELGSWQPGSYTIDGALEGARQRLGNRVDDLVRNDGWAAGTVSAFINSVVGATFRFSSKPNRRVLGLSIEEADRLGRQIETIWNEIAFGPGQWLDAGRRMDGAGLVALNVRHRLIDGDWFQRVAWRDRRDYPAAPWRTCIQTIHPERVSNPFDAGDELYRRGGVELDGLGAAVGFHVRHVHPGDEGLVGAELGWAYVARELPWGRPQMLQGFRVEEAGQARGVSPFAPVLKRLKMNSRYEAYEMQAAVANAVLAAFIESSLPAEVVAEALEDKSAASLNTLDDYRAGYYEAAPIRLNGIRMPVLPTGDRVNFPTSSRPNKEASNFVGLGLRNLAAATGLNPSQISRDYSQTNYSSERAAMLEAGKTIAWELATQGRLFGTPVLLAVLEEAIEAGRVELPRGAPGLYEAPGAYLAGRWLGAPRGWVDPTKEAGASQIRMDAGLSTLEAETAEQGLDWQEVLEQQALEQRERERLGLPAPGEVTVREQASQEDGGGAFEYRRGGDPSGSGQGRRPQGRSRIPNSPARRRG
ncbi:MAG: phage portal protein [Tistlia sp.]|uniref:phage portal protein n=1 Tax=Tistlia sp. TaxID=3057121 RepID=UPI0034A1F8C4